MQEAHSEGTMAEKDLVFGKTYKCPICDSSFKNLTVKQGKARMVSTDLDLKVNYRDIEPLKYDVILCPVCGYAALERYFDRVSVFQRKNIVEKISQSFQTVFEEKDEFTFEDVADEINKKLIHRHPHVFGDIKTRDVDVILSNWDKLKKEEQPHRQSVLDGISKSQSALMTAQKLSKKAVKVGFEWACQDDVLDCVNSEIKEFLEADNKEDKELEFGDILFALVNLARWNKIDAEQALIRANKKFEARFRKMEEIAKEENLELEKLSLEEWDCLWKKAKSILN